ncbi:MAG: AAA family ATPase [Bacteroidota bacterium]
MKSSCKIRSYRLIQLVSIISLSTLAQGYAEQVQRPADPGLRLEVESQNLQGPNRTIQVTITNTSTAVANLAKYSLVILEKHGKPVRVYYRNTASTIDELAWPESVCLAELIDIKALNVPEASQTFTLFLKPDGVPDAELILFIKDEKESILGDPVSVRWYAQGRRMLRLLDYYFIANEVVSRSIFTLCICVGLQILSKGYQAFKPFNTARQGPAKRHQRNTLASSELTSEVIKAHLDKHIIGQETAKKCLAVIGNEHLRRIQTSAEGQQQLTKQNVLMIGPTGSGKTLLADKLSEILGVPFYKADANSLTAAGYVGEDVESIILGLVAAAKYNVTAAEKGIIFIDEIDKLGASKDSRNMDIGGKKVQEAILTLLQGRVIEIAQDRLGVRPKLRINVANILFICAGAFASVRKLEAIQKRRGLLGRVQFLEDHGIIPELIGRLSSVIHLDPLKVADFSGILNKLENSPIEQWIKCFKARGIELAFSKDAIECLVQESFKSGLGARGLEAALAEHMYLFLFDVCRQSGQSSRKYRVAVAQNGYQSPIEQENGEGCPQGYLSLTLSPIEPDENGSGN